MLKRTKVMVSSGDGVMMRSDDDDSRETKTMKITARPAGWATRKEAESTVKRAYASRILSLAERFRLEHLIRDGKVQLAMEVVERMSTKGLRRRTSQRRDSVDGEIEGVSTRVLTLLREKVKKGDIERAEYDAIVAKMMCAAQSTGNDDDDGLSKPNVRRRKSSSANEVFFIPAETADTLRLRADIMNLERRKHAIRRKIDALTVRRAQDDLAIVRNRRVHAPGRGDVVRGGVDDDVARPVGDATVLKRYAACCDRIAGLSASLRARTSSTPSTSQNDPRL